MDFLFSSISSLKINKIYAERLKQLVGGGRIIDLLYHLPRKFLKRHYLENLAAIDEKSRVIIKVKILDYKINAGRGKTVTTVYTMMDNGTEVFIKYFNMKSLVYIKKQLEIGQKKFISGKLDYCNNVYSIVHPDFIKDNLNEISTIEPVYELTAGITNGFLTKLIRSILLRIRNNNVFEEWLPESLHMPSWEEAIEKCHMIPNNDKYKARLELDEILAFKEALKELRLGYKKGVSISMRDMTENFKKLFNEQGVLKGVDEFNLDKLTELLQLPFQLTGDQINAIKDVLIDLDNSCKMSRLLQGDVGSGKTMVALITSIIAIANGYQVALLAPTEMLAKQHFETFITFLNNIPAKYLAKSSFRLLISKSRNKSKIYEEIENGSIKLLIGTHALIEGNVKFQNLGYVIIDEQHKFGVKQREMLKEKNNLANVLYMSATPIPRTMMMIINADMDISYIKEKPKNRVPIKTITIASSRMSELIVRIEDLIQGDNRLFWVCPLIEESEKILLTPVVHREKYLKEKFGDKRVSMIHGKMNPQEKEAIINAFKENKIKILVATTVIEVGIDVPDANVIIIENAERFGLSQLHQLRGRVGRKDKESFCVLLYDENISTIAKNRISIIKNSTDGFEIAEQDLLMRGFGDCVGKQQTGLPVFKVIDPQNILLFQKAENIAIINNKAMLFKIFEKQM